ncbi:MAG: hypothetical protein JW963_08065 [Anaerolineales bacterium]|nr:hypothetical protein [Anaerolineales bacterium]
MKHPLETIPSASRKPLFWAFLAGTLVLFAVFRVLDAPLRTPAAPNGIVSFELAGTPSQAQAIIDSWQEMAVLANDVAGEPVPGMANRAYSFAVFGLGIDYLFMPVYATALALGILLAAGRHKGRFASLGAWLGWGAYAAALFDAVENYALVRMLLMNEVRSPYPEVAAFSATIKFGLLFLGLIYALVGWLWPNKSASS